MSVALRPKFIPPFKGSAGDPLLVGLESYWSLNEQSGTRYDAIGSNDLTDNNTVGYVNCGPRGVSAKILGVNNEYLNKLTTGLRQAGDFTIHVWVKLLAQAVGNVGIVHYVDGGGTEDYSIFQAAFTYTIYAQVRDSVAGTVNTSRAVSVNEWHSITLRYNSVDKKVYLSVDDDAETASAALANSLRQLGTDLRIGHPGGSQDSIISRVGLWSEGISAAERTELYNSGRGKSYADLSAGIKTNLVSYWNLDEVSEGDGAVTRVDSEGSNDLTDNNTVTSVNTGPESVVADFVHTNSESLSVASGVFNANADYTVSFWLNLHDGDTWAFPFVAYTADYSDAPLLIQWNAGNGIYALGHIPGADPLIQDANYPLDIWCYVTVTWDFATTTMELFIDGVSKGSDAAAGAQTAPVPTNLRIGGGVFGGTDYFTTGKMCMVGVWQHKLSSAEIVGLFNNGIGKKYSELSAAEKVGLVSYWNLTELSGNRADSHGANTLTDNNTVTCYNNKFGAANGVCAKFISGNSEYLSRASAVLPQNHNFTIVGWFAIDDSTDPYQHDLMDAGPGALDCGFFYDVANPNYRFYNWSGGGGGEIQVEKLWNTTTWVMAAYEYDASTHTSRQILFGCNINGGVWGAGVVNANIDLTTYFQLGRSNTYGRYLGGRMNDFGVWSRILDAAEYTRLFNNGRGRFLVGSSFVET